MFKIKRLPKKITLLILELQFLFDDCQWMHFQSLLASLLITPFKPTLCGMSKVLGFGTHRSKHNAFIINSADVIRKALQYYAHTVLSLLKKTGEPIYFIFDDTTNKKTGKHIEGAFKYYDHLSKTYIKGQQIVCSIISYRGLIIPYGFDVYIPKEQCLELGITFKKKTQLALEQLKSFEADDNQKIFILADTFYATEPIMNYCRNNNQSFVSSLKFNRVFKVNGHETNVSKYLKHTIKDFKKSKKIKLGKITYRVESREVELKTGGAVKLVFTKHPMHHTAMVLVTTDTALSVSEIMHAYRIRWNIEVFFKMSKQNLGFNGYQSRDIGAIRSRIALSMLSYNLLTHAFIKDMRAKGKSLTAKNISKFSITEMLGEIRYQINVESIEHHFDEMPLKLSKKIKKEFKSLLIKAA
ncbi:MAG: transposase [Ignavibacteriae bacterium]|nr:transposase [Ignavibacteriota bacterium]